MPDKLKVSILIDTLRNAPLEASASGGSLS